MTGFALLDVAIGVIFIVLTFSLIASAVHEAVASGLNWRGRMLRRGIWRLLEDDRLGKALESRGLVPGGLRARAALTLRLLGHPLIKALHGPKSVPGALYDRLVGSGDGNEGRLPANIPNTVFATALLDILRALDPARAEKSPTPAPGKSAADAAAAALTETTARASRGMERAANAIASLSMGDGLKTRLLTALAETRQLEDRRARLTELIQRTGAEVDDALANAIARLRSEIAELETGIEAIIAEIGTWFETAMERIHGWYIRRTRFVLFVIGLVMAGSVNLDLIGYADRLLNDTDLRARAVASAEEAAASGAVGAFRIPTPRPEAPTQNVLDVVDAGTQVLQTSPAAQVMGWRCDPVPFLACVADPRRWSLAAVLSWLIIGLCCSLGGQFWFDLLKMFLNVRSAAAGIATDSRRLGARPDRAAPGDQHSA